MGYLENGQVICCSRHLRQVRQKVQGQLRAAQVRHLFIDSLAVNTIYIYIYIILYLYVSLFLLNHRGGLHFFLKSSLVR